MNCPVFHDVSLEVFGVSGCEVVCEATHDGYEWTVRMPDGFERPMTKEEVSATAERVSSLHHAGRRMTSRVRGG